MTTHTIIVQMNSDQSKVLRAQYFESKFPRELGDRLTINNVSWNVGIIGDDKDSCIEAMNVIIKKQNSINRKEQKKEDQKVWASIMNQLSDELPEMYGSIRNLKPTRFTMD